MPASAPTSTAASAASKRRAIFDTIADLQKLLARPTLANAATQAADIEKIMSGNFLGMLRARLGVKPVLIAVLSSACLRYVRAVS